MHNYVLSCCSTADLAKEHFESRDISYICFHYFLDGKEYPDDLGQTMPFDQFYQAMVDGADTKTSQVSAGEYIEYFSKFLDEGKDILHLTLSSGISGSYMSACAAQKTLAEKYPDRKIRIVDSLSAASGYGLLIDAMADLRDEGKSLDEVADWAAVVQRAAEVAKEGDVVVMSPASTSFDMFPNFMVKGKVFKELVNALE